MLSKTAATRTESGVYLFPPGVDFSDHPAF